MPNEDNSHHEKMAKKKAVFDRTKARATEDKGLIVVHTGAGKGKTTAALGMVLRAVGHGMRVGMVQFIKGALPTGERLLHDQKRLAIDLFAMGEGFTWETQNRERDIKMAHLAWEKAVSLIHDPTYNLVVLDELNVILYYDYLPSEEVLSVLKQKRPELHVIITGRYAKDELIELADLVTEMRLVKHPYRKGIRAQKGIEF